MIVLVNRIVILGKECDRAYRPVQAGLVKPFPILNASDVKPLS